jgi:hypothetical protein
MKKLRCIEYPPLDWGERFVIENMKWNPIPGWNKHIFDKRTDFDKELLFNRFADRNQKATNLYWKLHKRTFA